MREEETQTPDEESSIPVQAPPRTITQVSVRTDTRVVVQWGSLTPSPRDVDIDGNPTIEGGLGARDGCTIEEVSPETLTAIQATMPPHGGGVVLSADHSEITAAPEPEHYQVLLNSEKARTAALAALVAHAQANPDDPTALLAKALGLV